MNERTLSQKIFFILVAASLLSVFSGCGSVQHSVDFQKDYMPKIGMKIEVGPAMNETGQKFDVEIEEMLATALVERLQDEELLCTGKEGSKLVTNCIIREYKKGDAFKRWVMPGWGSTVLTVQCDLMDGNIGVGIVNARRTVDAGGAYTVGAWANVFKRIAEDIVGDLRDRIKN